MPQIIPVGGANWTLDFCGVRLKHTIFLKEKTRGDIIFTFYTNFLGNLQEMIWTTLLDNNLDLLLLLTTL